ncbi:MAG: hypothetical protein GWN71_00935, partial [Gammaproteobacteria bacterium]|nr:hypothetical protein [Gemmatimonadota bacterium]NIU72183.1 hypothetical protein [Gammaproteobacteria bacterium]
MIAGAAFVVAVALAILVWPWRSEGPAGGREAVTAESMRVAVLPFTPHGFGADEEGLSEGAAQLVALGLETRGSLEVVPHRRVLAAWERAGLSGARAFNAESLSALAGELGATSLVLGDLHASGDELRIVAELVGSRAGAVLARADIRGPRDSL